MARPVDALPASRAKERARQLISTDRPTLAALAFRLAWHVARHHFPGAQLEIKISKLDKLPVVLIFEDESKVGKGSALNKSEHCFESCASVAICY